MELGEKIFRWIIRSTNRSMTIMRRSIKYIVLALVAVVWTVACVNEMELSEPILEQQQLTLVPRVHSFANQYVTKANPYGSTETKITQLAVLVFDKGGNLAHIQDHTVSEVSSVSLNKSMLNLSPATVVMIANMQLADIKKVNTDNTTTSLADVKNRVAALTLGDLDHYSFHYDEAKTVINNLEENFSGFPMIGRIDNVNLTTTQTGAIEVPLKILYAKINFNISVEASTDNELNNPTFDLDGYSVYNASKATILRDLTLTDADNGESPATYEPTVSSDYAYKNTNPDDPNGTPQGFDVNYSTNTTSFTFYISESRFNHGADVNTIYPGWINDPDIDADLKNSVMQKYKPVLATASGNAKPGQGLATFVLLKGQYTDYRETVWTVNYKVYLGKDNTQNFQVDRNSEYINKITIKGIRNYDAEDGRGEVWIDHRVDVEGTDSAAECVTITRETLIDAHIEVRPLRVSWKKEVNEKGEVVSEQYAGVRVYLPTNSDNSLVNWIGIERFTGTNNQDESIYCFQDGKSIGKRKYFTAPLLSENGQVLTQGLISELQTKDGELGVHDDNGKKYIYLLNGECAWIYFDENTTSNSRNADIKLAFYNTSGNVVVEETYRVKQSGLLSVGGYSIESYEEYLHTYDSTDDYNLSTSPVDYTQQGLAWGLDDVRISKDIVVSAGPRSTWTFYQTLVNQRYDYFHESDQPTGNTYYFSTKDDADNWIDASAGTGLIFTDRASYNEGITVKDMGTLPENAYQYCLSKNKFAVDEDGNVSMIINWYLPDVYEMQSVLTANQNSGGVADFATDASYWSSQPSFTTSGIQQINIAFVDEDPSQARAVSSSGIISNIERDKQHRIRCLYSKEGLTANMGDRTPDGVGGNYTFTMKGNPADGYFRNILPVAKSVTDLTYEYNYDNKNDEYPDIPEKSNSYNVSGAEFTYVVMTNKAGETVEGFEVDPALQTNWSKYNVLGRPTEYYTTLATYPGLSAYTLEQYTLLGQPQDAYRPTQTRKERTETTVTASAIRCTNKILPGATDLDELQLSVNGQTVSLELSFEGNGTTDPTFEYDKYLSGTKEVSVQNWAPPVYKGTTHVVEPQSEDLEAEGTGTESEASLTLNWAKQAAFNAAYNTAKEDALMNLTAIRDSLYPGWIMGTPTYTPLTWQSKEPDVKYTDIDESGFRKWATCTVKLIGKVTITSENRTLYLISSGAEWTEVSNSGPVPIGNEVLNIDELRIYCGNSFTIKLPTAYAKEYEITKVKVYYSGSNYVDSKGGFLGFGEDDIYARFVESSITLPKSITVPKGGSNETLQLPGMDYDDDLSSGTGTHQWSGEGRSSVTMVLADYYVNDDAGNNTYTYKYDNASMKLTKYIVVDKIEVKCTPKKTTDETTP